MIRNVISSYTRGELVTTRLSNNNKKLFSTTFSPRLANVQHLRSWELEAFQRLAFQPARPAQLPRLASVLPPACASWFIHDNRYNQNLQSIDRSLRGGSSELRTSFWCDYEDTIVPLELTCADEQGSISFQRAEAPLKLLLTYLSNPKTPNGSSDQLRSSSVYLAQCDLRDLPTRLQQDIPTPKLVLSAGTGDIYSTSLWLGRPPTYTPLHRDPNPNLFMQLAGRKIVRLFEPDVGNEIFDLVQSELEASRNTGTASAKFRGEEMMAGSERQVLHDLIWGCSEHEYVDSASDKHGNGMSQAHFSSLHPEVMEHCHEASLEMGEALFIPKGWWHSVKGVGNGVTGSVNWWFR